MKNMQELEQASSIGTLYDSMRENLKEVSELFEKEKPTEEDEGACVTGAIETFGYLLIDAAESLDRIADAVEEQFS